MFAIHFLPSKASDFSLQEANKILDGHQADLQVESEKDLMNEISPIPIEEEVCDGEDDDESATKGEFEISAERMTITDSLTLCH